MMSSPFPREAQNLIAAFKGLPPDKSRSIPRKIRPLDALIEDLQKKFQWEEKSTEQVIMENWRQIVGEKAAHRARPGQLVRGKTLVITVTNSILRQEMSFSQNNILSRIRRLPGCQDIREVVIRHG